MRKYIFVTHIDVRERAGDIEVTYHCNYFSRVDNLLEDFLVTQLSGEEPTTECNELARTIERLKLVSRFNPQRKYKMSVVVFSDDREDFADEVVELVNQDDEETIKMIRNSDDTRDL